MSRRRPPRNASLSFAKAADAKAVDAKATEVKAADVKAANGPARPSSRLPRGIIRRGERLSMRFKDLEGQWRTRSTGLRVGQEAEAAALLAEVCAQLEVARRAREAAGHDAALSVPTDPASSPDDPWGVRGETRFADFGAAWVVRREAEGLRCGASGVWNG